MGKGQIKQQYPNGLLKDIRNSARAEDPSALELLKSKLEEQKGLPKANNPFKTASKTVLRSYLKSAHLK